MIFWLAVAALLVVLIYFIINWQRSQQDATWRSFRQHFREKNDRPSPEQPIDPNFQFDQPSVDEETEN